MLHPAFVFVAAALNLIGTVAYLRGTLTGKTRPNRVTWFLWAFAPFVAFGAELQEGVGIQALMTFAVGFGPLLIFIASFVNRKAYWQLSTFDYVCGGLSLLGLAFWLVIQQGNVAIALAIGADALAAVPTLVKAFKDPDSENATAFGLAGVGAAITLATITVWDFAHISYPLYILSICATLYVLIRFQLGKKVRRNEGARSL